MSTKKDFPLLANSPDLVYLDSGATSQKPQSVIDAVVNFYQEKNANPHRSLYPLTEIATDVYEGAREAIAKFIGAKAPNCIAFTSGVTMGINVVAYAWARRNLKAGDMILSTIMEHHANIVPWQNIARENTGIEFKLVKMSDNGILNLNDLENKLKDGNVKLLCVAHVSNVLGTLNPIKKIAALAHKYGAAILVDGAQAVGHLPINVSNLGVDFYAFSGHKMLGPMGSGALYIAPQRHLEMGTMFAGGDMISRVTSDRAWFKPIPYRLEAGTQSVADLVGLQEAINYLNNFPGGLKGVQNHTKVLGAYAWNKLKKIPNIKMIGPGPGKNWSHAVISFTFDHRLASNGARIKDSDLARKLGEKGICVRSGLFCAQPLVEERLGLTGAVRVSIHVYNNLEDIDKLVNEIKNIQKK